MYMNIIKFGTFSMVAMLAACGETTNTPASAPAPSETAVDEPTPELPAEVVMPESLVPDMSEWTVVDGASLEKLEGDMADAYKVAFTNGATLIGFDPKNPIKAGETLTASFLAWSDTPDTELRVRIARYCTDGEIEQTVETRKLKEVPTRVEVSHTFERDQECARLQFDSRQDEASYNVAGVIVRKD